MPNVVFPAAIEEVDGVRYVFYGMAGSGIGVARLDLEIRLDARPGPMLPSSNLHQFDTERPAAGPDA